MQHIDSLGDEYCIRTKSNVAIEIDNYDDAPMIAYISDIEPFFSKPRYFDSVRITSFKFPTKLAVSKTDTHKEPFFILTNGNTREAIKHYGYRFGSIEFIFKNYFKIKYSKKNGANNKRIISLFNTGLIFFNLAFESTKYVLLKCDFLLYDI